MTSTGYPRTLPVPSGLAAERITTSLLSVNHQISGEIAQTLFSKPTFKVDPFNIDLFLDSLDPRQHLVQKLKQQEVATVEPPTSCVHCQTFDTLPGIFNRLSSLQGLRSITMDMSQGDFRRA